MNWYRRWRARVAAQRLEELRIQQEIERQRIETAAKYIFAVLHGVAALAAALEEGK